MRRFLKRLGRRRNLERELEAELAFHHEMAQAAGNSIPLGNTLLIRERSVDPWRFSLLEDLWRDAAYGIRSLRRSPMLFLVAVLAMALGIGSATAVFSLVNAVLLKPVPVPDPRSFVELMSPVGAGTSPAQFAWWREQTGVVHDVSAYMPGTVNYASGDEIQELNSMQVSAAALDCWGTRILRGRGFTSEEDAPRGPHAVILGEDFWRRRFAQDSRVLGRTITLNGDAYTVIGVAADSAFLLEQGALPEVYVPLQIDPGSRDPNLNRAFRVAARLNKGVSLAHANASVQASASGFNATFPGKLRPGERFSVVPYRQYLAGGDFPLLKVLMGAVGLVLLIACANVANLLLVRSETRRREIAIRTAIGAGRLRILRQLLAESLLLALAGGALGSVVGYAGVRALLAINTAGLPRLGENGAAVGIDGRVLLFALGISVLTGIVFGLAPAIKGSRAGLSGMGIAGPSSNTLRGALVVAETGLAVLLLAGSALLIRTFVKLYSVAPGFDAGNVITMRMKMTGARFQKAAAVGDAMRDGLERIRALPGVEAAAATYFIPLQTAIASSFDVVGEPPGPPRVAGWVPVSSGYFETFRIPVKRGRAFTDRDDSASPPVAVINEAMAKLYWKGADPLQSRIVIGSGRPQFRGEPERQIVGVVGDIHDTQLSSQPRPTMYVPQAQIPDGMNALLVRIQPVAWIVRTRGEPQALVPAIRRQLRQETGLPVAEVRPMSGVVANSRATQRFNMLLMTAFGGAALLLAAIGIYGLMAYSVEQRSREIGIRLALGAETKRLRNRVVIEGMRLALAGVAIGVAAAFGLTRFLASLLYGVPPRDPLVFATVPFILGAVACAAVWIPARRASRIDPIQALRHE